MFFFKLFENCPKATLVEMVGAILVVRRDSFDKVIFSMVNDNYIITVDVPLINAANTRVKDEKR